MINVADEYLRCRCSITCHSDDLAVAHCLRSLCHFAERDLSLKNIGWTDSGEDEWKQDGNCITLRFTAPEFRDAFVLTARKVLVADCWREVSRSDNDPAPTPIQRKIRRKWKQKK